MERNSIELMAHTITIVDENTATKFTVPDPVCTGDIKEVPAFEKIINVQNLITMDSTWEIQFNVYSVLTILNFVSGYYYFHNVPEQVN